MVEAASGSRAIVAALKVRSNARGCGQHARPIHSTTGSRTATPEEPAAAAHEFRAPDDDDDDRRRRLAPERRA